MRVALKDNTDLNVESAGTGEPVVILIHGIGADLTFWRGVVPTISKVSRVVSYDLRGFGISGFPKEPRLSIDLWANDLRELMDKLGLKRATLVGWSLGGIISIKFALGSPERVNSLVLVGATTKLQPSAKEFFEKRARLAENEGMQELVRETFHTTEEAFAPSVRSDHPEKVQVFKEMLAKNNKDAYAATSRALVETDLTMRLVEIKQPALIVVGQYDTRTPLADSELMCMMMENSVMKIMPDCGHFYPIEQPESLGRILSNYLMSTWS